MPRYLLSTHGTGGAISRGRLDRRAADRRALVNGILAVPWIEALRALGVGLTPEAPPDAP
jgi:hypothetical protein